VIGVGIIGYGYWGPNLVRNFFETPGCKVVAVSDLRAERLAAVRARYPTIDTLADYRDLLRDSRIDAVAIATPVSTHFDLGLKALAAGKHVLMEKPISRWPATRSRRSGSSTKPTCGGAFSPSTTRSSTPAPSERSASS
jgi:predicted dehydrogenase